MFLFTSIFMVFLLYVIFIIAMFLFSDIFFIKSKSLSFECGIENIKECRISFSYQFFYIGVVFILFDMEIIFLIHFLMFFNTFMYLYYYMFFLLFIIFMYFTLLIEWKWSSLNWMM